MEIVFRKNIFDRGKKMLIPGVGPGKVMVEYGGDFYEFIATAKKNKYIVKTKKGNK
jgi:hypothetical protein